MNNTRKLFNYFFVIAVSNFVFADISNTTNHHGITGLLNTPTARLGAEGEINFTISRNDPDRKFSITASPYSWIEGGFFYSDVTGKEYGNGFEQSYKDKGFNVKVLLKSEGRYPSLALGFNDFAGTGFYSSEYLVSNYAYKKFDFSLGIGWGNYAGSGNIKNPFISLSDSFENRDGETNFGGNVDFDNYFSGKNVSLFGGFKYLINDKTNFILEYDPTLIPGDINYETADTRINIGVEYELFNNVFFTSSFERGNSLNFKFSVKDNISTRSVNKYTYRDIEEDSKLLKLAVNLQENNISLESLDLDNNNNLVISVRQNNYQSLDEVTSVISKLNEQIRLSDNEITIKNYLYGKEVTTNSFNNKGASKYQKIERNIYSKSGEFPRFFQQIEPQLRTFIGGREGLLFYGLFLEHNSRYMFSDSLFIDSHLALSVANNFDDLTIPPVTTYPRQVRSDIKDYLNGIDEGLAIKRLQVNKFIKLGDRSYMHVSGGVLEDMFNGVGFEYLKHEIMPNVSLGAEIFRVKKRGYEYDFEMLDYMKTTGHFNLYYKFGQSGIISKFSWGQYLAGDEGATLKVWKRFRNGAEMGAYASFTDVSFDEYGEGSFDKGVFFKVPIAFGNQKSFTNFGWKPLTKDPAAKLNKAYELYNEMLRFE